VSGQQTTTFVNTVNDPTLYVGIKESTAFTCTVGNITSTYQHYSQNTGFAYASGTALWSTSTALSADIIQGSNGSATPTEPIYWLLTTPTSGISGACTGANYFEAQ
jgi:hypothetical protein